MRSVYRDLLRDLNSRTAGYGSVRPVVWQGSSGRIRCPLCRSGRARGDDLVLARVMLTRFRQRHSAYLPPLAASSGGRHSLADRSTSAMPDRGRRSVGQRVRDVSHLISPPSVADDTRSSDRGRFVFLIGQRLFELRGNRCFLVLLPIPRAGSHALVDATAASHLRLCVPTSPWGAAPVMMSCASVSCVTRFQTTSFSVPLSSRSH
jgi:hypothetical protein